MTPLTMPSGLPIPERIRRSCRWDETRKMPVPWFVSWIDGRPEFRVADADKLPRAVREKLCWVCGETLDDHPVFVIGPMCAVNRVTSEPPCHKECAEFSARACPFLSRPRMERREAGLPEDTCLPAGEMIRRNPGCVCLWASRHTLFGDGNGGTLFRLSNPEWVRWFAEGRAATLHEALASIESGLPLLMNMARRDGREAVAALGRMKDEAMRHLPHAS